MNLNKLNPDCYEEFEREIILIEEDSNVKYQLTVKLKASSKKGIFIKLPKIKELSAYLQQNHQIAHPPKDCDAIIIDQDRQTAYLIEMKRSSKASSNERIHEQLTAGEKWLQHICFCTDMDNNFTVIKIAVMVENRRSKSRVKQEGLVKGYNFYKILGKFLSLEFLP